MTLRRICAWCYPPHDLAPQPGDDEQPDGVSHGCCPLAATRLEVENRSLRVEMRTVIVPEMIYRSALAIAREFDRLDGIEPGSVGGCRWDLIIWYLVGCDVRRPPAEVAAELRARLRIGG